MDPLFFFAGMWCRWEGVRKIKEGWIASDLCAFLTTEPNAEVAAVHQKSMPVILTSGEERNVSLRAPCAEAQALQRVLPDGMLVSD